MKTIHISEIQTGDKFILDLSSMKKKNLILAVDEVNLDENCVTAKSNPGYNFHPDDNGMFIQP